MREPRIGIMMFGKRRLFLDGAVRGRTMAVNEGSKDIIILLTGIVVAAAILVNDR
jgi:hypothetical protein